MPGRAYIEGREQIESLEDVKLALFEIVSELEMSKGLVFRGKVKAVPGPNQFTITELADLDAGRFASATAPYRAFVSLDAGGAGAAPEGEMQPVTAYDDSSGTFTTDPFTVAVTPGDEVMIIHPRLAEISDLVARIGNPDADILTSLRDKFGDIARSIDLILGSRWDLVGDLGSDIAVIIAAIADAGGLTFKGTVTEVPDATHFRISTFIGYGSTFFRNWEAYVVWDAAGLGAAPQDEHQQVSAFNSADATFTHPAYTAPLVVGDKISLFHPWLMILADWLDGGRLDLLLDAIKAQTDRLAGGETVATHVHANNVNWQTVVTIDPAGLRRKVHSIWMNFVNLTQNTIWRLSYNYGGLGVYEEFTSNAIDPWTPAMANGVLIDCRAVIGHELRLEIQSQVLEGAPRDVPYEVYWEQME